MNKGLLTLAVLVAISSLSHAKGVSKDCPLRRMKMASRSLDPSKDSCNFRNIAAQQKSGAVATTPGGARQK